MSERLEAHVDLAGYVLGRLNPHERARFEEHLASCPDCREEARGLAQAAELMALVPPAARPSRDLEARTLAAVRRAASENGGPRETAPAPAPRRGPLAWPRWTLRLGVAALAAVALAGAFLIGGVALDDEVGGTREITAVLSAPDGGGASASVEVTRTGIGRVVHLSSDDLPILPTGELYEVWFVGPDDRPGAPQRISAGTFHPDEDGRSDVTLAAAVDPALFPTISVTAEPGDGDPGPGQEVLRSSEP